MQNKSIHPIYRVLHFTHFSNAVVTLFSSQQYSIDTFIEDVDKSQLEGPDPHLATCRLLLTYMQEIQHLDKRKNYSVPKELSSSFIEKL